MRYIMQEKLFTWANNFTIRNEHDQNVFQVNGKVIALGNQLSFQDTAGNELAYIRQKLLAWLPRYEIYCAGQLAATVNKSGFSLFRCRFSVDVPGPDDLVAEGNFLEHEYRFERDEQTVATVSKRWFTVADTYGIEIGDQEDHVLILACSVVIDLVCHAATD